VAIKVEKQEVDELMSLEREVYLISINYTRSKF
jgi:hypothetical protein